MQSNSAIAISLLRDFSKFCRGRNHSTSNRSYVAWSAMKKALKGDGSGIEDMENLLGRPFAARFDIFTNFLTEFNMKIEECSDEQLLEFIVICQDSGEFEVNPNELEEEPVSPLRQALKNPPSPKGKVKYTNVTAEFLGSKSQAESPRVLDPPPRIRPGRKDSPTYAEVTTTNELIAESDMPQVEKAPSVKIAPTPVAPKEVPNPPKLDSDWNVIIKDVYIKNAFSHPHWNDGDIICSQDTERSLDKPHDHDFAIVKKDPLRIVFSNGASLEGPEAFDIILYSGVFNRIPSVYDTDRKDDECITRLESIFRNKPEGTGYSNLSWDRQVMSFPSALGDTMVLVEGWGEGDALSEFIVDSDPPTIFCSDGSMKRGADAFKYLREQGVAATVPLRDTPEYEMFIKEPDQAILARTMRQEPPVVKPPPRIRTFRVSRNTSVAPSVASPKSAKGADTSANIPVAQFIKGPPLPPPLAHQPVKPVSTKPPVPDIPVSCIYLPMGLDVDVWRGASLNLWSTQTVTPPFNELMKVFSSQDPLSVEVPEGVVIVTIPESGTIYFESISSFQRRIGAGVFDGRSRLTFGGHPLDLSLSDLPLNQLTCRDMMPYLESRLLLVGRDTGHFREINKVYAIPKGWTAIVSFKTNQFGLFSESEVWTQYDEGGYDENSFWVCPHGFIVKSKDNNIVLYGMSFSRAKDYLECCLASVSSSSSSQDPSENRVKALSRTARFFEPRRGHIFRACEYAVFDNDPKPENREMLGIPLTSYIPRSTGSGPLPVDILKTSPTTLGLNRVLPDQTAYLLVSAFPQKAVIFRNPYPEQTFPDRNSDKCLPVRSGVETPLLKIGLIRRNPTSVHFMDVDQFMDLFEDRKLQATDRIVFGGALIPDKKFAGKPLTDVPVDVLVRASMPPYHMRVNSQNRALEKDGPSTGNAVVLDTYAAWAYEISIEKLKECFECGYMHGFKFDISFHGLYLPTSEETVVYIPFDIYEGLECMYFISNGGGPMMVNSVQGECVSDMSALKRLFFPTDSGVVHRALRFRFTLNNNRPYSETMVHPRTSSNAVLKLVDRTPPPATMSGTDHLRLAVEFEATLDLPEFIKLDRCAEPLTTPPEPAESYHTWIPRFSCMVNVRTPAMRFYSDSKQQRQTEDDRVHSIPQEFIKTADGLEMPMGSVLKIIGPRRVYTPVLEEAYDQEVLQRQTFDPLNAIIPAGELFSPDGDKKIPETTMGRLFKKCYLPYELVVGKYFQDFEGPANSIVSIPEGTAIVKSTETGKCIILTESEIMEDYHGEYYRYFKCEISLYGFIIIADQKNHFYMSHHWARLEIFLHEHRYMFGVAGMRLIPADSHRRFAPMVSQQRESVRFAYSHHMTPPHNAYPLSHQGVPQGRTVSLTPAMYFHWINSPRKAPNSGAIFPEPHPRSIVSFLSGGQTSLSLDPKVEASSSSASAPPPGPEEVPDQPRATTVTTPETLGKPKQPPSRKPYQNHSGRPWNERALGTIPPWTRDANPRRIYKWLHHSQSRSGTIVSDDIPWKYLLSTIPEEEYFDIDLIGIPPTGKALESMLYHPTKYGEENSTPYDILQVTLAGHPLEAITLTSWFSVEDLEKLSGPEKEYRKFTKLQIPPHAMINIFKRCTDEKDASFPRPRMIPSFSLKSESPPGWTNFGRGAVVVHISLLVETAYGPRPNGIKPHANLSLADTTDPHPAKVVFKNVMESDKWNDIRVPPYKDALCVAIHRLLSGSSNQSPLLSKVVKAFRAHIIPLVMQSLEVAASPLKYDALDYTRLAGRPFGPNFTPYGCPSTLPLTAAIAGGEFITERGGASESAPFVLPIAPSKWYYVIGHLLRIAYLQEELREMDIDERALIVHRLSSLAQITRDVFLGYCATLENNKLPIFFCTQNSDFTKQIINSIAERYDAVFKLDHPRSKFLLNRGPLAIAMLYRHPLLYFLRFVGEAAYFNGSDEADEKLHIVAYLVVVIIMSFWVNDPWMHSTNPFSDAEDSFKRSLYSPTFSEIGDRVSFISGPRDENNKPVPAFEQMIIIVDKYLEAYGRELTDMVDHDVMEMACSSCFSWDLVCALTPMKNDVEKVEPETKYPELVPRDLITQATRFEEIALVSMSSSLSMLTSGFHTKNGQLYKLPLPMRTCENHILPGIKLLNNNLANLPNKLCAKSGIDGGIFSSSAKRAAERFDEFSEKYGTWESISGILTPSFVNKVQTDKSPSSDQSGPPSDDDNDLDSKKDQKKQQPKEDDPPSKKSNRKKNKSTDNDNSAGATGTTNLSMVVPKSSTLGPHYRAIEGDRKCYGVTRDLGNARVVSGEDPSKGVVCRPGLFLGIVHRENGIDQLTGSCPRDRSTGSISSNRGESRTSPVTSESERRKRSRTKSVNFTRIDSLRKKRTRVPPPSRPYSKRQLSKEPEDPENGSASKRIVKVLLFRPTNLSDSGVEGNRQDTTSITILKKGNVQSKRVVNHIECIIDETQDKDALETMDLQAPKEPHSEDLAAHPKEETPRKTATQSVKLSKLAKLSSTSTISQTKRVPSIDSNDNRDKLLLSNSTSASSKLSKGQKKRLRKAGALISINSKVSTLDQLSNVIESNKPTTHPPISMSSNDHKLNNTVGECPQNVIKGKRRNNKKRSPTINNNTMKDESSINNNNKKNNNKNLLNDKDEEDNLVDDNDNLCDTT